MLKKRRRLDFAQMMKVQSLFLLFSSRSLFSFTGIPYSQLCWRACGRPSPDFRIARRYDALLLGGCAVRQPQARQDKLRLPHPQLDSRFQRLGVVDDQPQLVFA